MDLNRNDTALVVIDPQNDVLSEKGVSWGLVGDSVKENNTVENLARLFKAAKDQGFGVFISPHYLYPTDQAPGDSFLAQDVVLRVDDDQGCILLAELHEDAPCFAPL